MTRSELKRRLKAAEDLQTKGYRKALALMSEDDLNDQIQSILSKLNLPHPIDLNSMSIEELQNTLTDYM